VGRLTQFSANLGFLWTELALPDAIRAAAKAGFVAVECHWPYDTPVEDVKAALIETELPMLGLNTLRGNVAKGDNGLSALPDRIDEARAAIDQAIAYAAAVGCRAVHVMAGFCTGSDAKTCFVENLKYAVKTAALHDITILIEPLNHYDAPGYFLTTTTQAVEIIKTVNAPNLKLMFDCYHVQLMEGDLSNRIAKLRPHIGHIQFAGVPARGRPDVGEVAYAHIFETIAALDYHKPLGAEYKPGGDTDATLGWMNV
jgi:hydroxypyruvate isomerase